MPACFLQGKARCVSTAVQPTNKKGTLAVLPCNQSVLFNNVLFVQVAAEWAAKKLDDFATIVQPFLSETTADSFNISFLSDVS